LSIRLDLRQFDDFEGDAVFGRRRCGPFAGVALIDESDLDTFVGLRLNRPVAILPIAARSSALVGVTWRARRCRSVSIARCSFEPFFRLAPS
jgi:hypothetical protein